MARARVRLASVQDLLMDVETRPGVFILVCLPFFKIFIFVLRYPVSTCYFNLPVLSIPVLFFKSHICLSSNA